MQIPDQTTKGKRIPMMRKSGKRFPLPFGQQPSCKRIANTEFTDQTEQYQCENTLETKNSLPRTRIDSEWNTNLLKTYHFIQKDCQRIVFQFHMFKRRSCTESHREEYPFFSVNRIFRSKSRAAWRERFIINAHCFDESSTRTKSSKRFHYYCCDIVIG